MGFLQLSWTLLFPHLLFHEQFHENKCGETNGACIICRKIPSSHFYDTRSKILRTNFPEEVFFGLSHEKKGSLHTILPDTWHIEPNCLWHPIIWRDHPFHVNFFFPLFKGRQLKRSPDYSLFVPGLVTGQIIDCSQ